MKALLKILAALVTIWNELNGSARARRKWEKKDAELQKRFDDVREKHQKAVDDGAAPAAGVYRDQWLRISRELARHRDLGRRAGYLD